MNKTADQGTENKDISILELCTNTFSLSPFISHCNISYSLYLNLE
jgi:hypothetical protein